MKPSWTLLNARVDDLALPALLDHLAAHGGVVHTINLDHYWHLQRDAAFAAAYRAADVVTCDSHYVQAALRWLGRPLAHRITGSDLVPALCHDAAQTGRWRVFLLGARPGVADRAMAAINAREGQRVVVGALGPSMRFVQDEAEIDAALAAITASGANVLCVGLGAPKQEIWMAHVRDRLPGVRVLMGVGATIDYESGALRRAPPSWSRWKMEWLYRVLTEPGRYALRYARCTAFFRWVLQERLGLYRDPFANR
ncbi:MAG: WecB/TagA/CpsF family glycosyltransferase [Proteobacteria bacterium]|nr:WecB/TagA/CpsF family glycosyltransferase [Pseudomonadota bacterium]